MISYIIRRVLYMIPIVIVVSVVVFLLKSMSPIDASEVRAQNELQDPDHPEYENLYRKHRSEMGLDKPLFYLSIRPQDEVSIFPPCLEWHGLNNQYHMWLVSFVGGNYGTSLLDGRTVSSKVYRAMRWTLALSLLSLLITILIGLPLGIFQAAKEGSFIDRLVNILGSAVHSMPIFWLGTLAILFLTSSQYGAMWHWFSAPGLWRASQSTFVYQLWSNIDLLVLPVLLMSVRDIVYIARLARTSVLEESRKSYTVALRAKGLSEDRMYKNHIVPNALSPVITLLVSAIPNILGGALVIEVLFNIPGMGRLMYESIMRSDWEVVFPVVMLTTVITVIAYLLGDICMALLYPKIRKT